jgi:hypothetical protein
MRHIPFAIVFACSASAAMAQGTPADAGPDTTLCVHHFTLQGSALAAGEVGVWTIVSGCGSIANPTDPDAEYLNICSGINVLQWTVTDSTGTLITSDQVVITVYEIEMPTLPNAGPDQLICLPQNTALMSANNIPFPATGYWTVVQGSFIIVDPTDPYTQFAGLTAGTNIAAWNIDNGICEDPQPDMVVITVDICSGVAPRPVSESALMIRQEGAVTWIGSDVAIDGMRVIDPLGREVWSFGPELQRGWSVVLPQMLGGSYIAVAHAHDGTGVLVGRFVVE